MTDDDISRVVDRRRREAAEYAMRLDYAVQYRDETAIEHVIRTAAGRVLGAPGGVGFDLVRSIWAWLVVH
ncbi:hypothetical protein [Sphaerisporangium aureirubrum]|uniref:Uncharacterized protein n=1 Tax=Sphaerisporangium aureirubrum TaxID=1544736 RepID=A0ABW1NGT0_9ACTN